MSSGAGPVPGSDPGDDERVPAPGRPGSLGSEVDRADAADLLAVLKAVRGHHDRGGGNAYKVAREALWFMWEQRRLPRPLIRGKYPVSYPWSPDARLLLERHRGAGRPDSSFGGVVIEHLVPATLMVQEALGVAPDLDTDGMLELLGKHGAAAVVSIADDKRLTAAGVRSTMPTGWDGDPWARPRAAGLDPASFAPLASRPQPSEAVARREKSAPETGGVARPATTDRGYTWESYITDAGHPPSKVTLARAIAEQVESITGWPSARTAGQIVFRANGRRMLAIQLWLVDGVRLEADIDDAPPADLFGPATGKKTKKGSWYWTLLSAEGNEPAIARLIDLLRADHPPSTSQAIQP